MKKATSQQFNIQDQRLNESRKEGKTITIVLLDGREFKGIVQAFDLFCISFISTFPLADLLIYKHSVAYIKFND